MLTQELLVRMCRTRAALENLDADVTVASLAKSIRLSRSQFIARYRAAFGDTPYQTRIRARLERAKWLLATSDLTVTEICMAVGFSSLGSFSHQFRLRCGESPVRYRARLARGIGLESAAARLAPHCVQLMAAAWAEPSYFSRSLEQGRPLESVV